MMLILTGPPAAGKTTTAPQLAARLPRCAVIDVDLIRAMVVQPHIAPWRGEAGRAQLRLGALNACLLAQNFHEAGYDVIMLDVLTDETATIYRQQLERYGPKIVLLLPALAVSLERNRARGQPLTDAEVRLLYGWQQQLTEYDLRIDNTQQSVEQLVDQLLIIMQKIESSNDEHTG